MRIICGEIAYVPGRGTIGVASALVCNIVYLPAIKHSGSQIFCDDSFIPSSCYIALKYLDIQCS